MSRITLSINGTKPSDPSIKNGAAGAIKKSSMFGRSIKVDVSSLDSNLKPLKLNRGSLIDFLNANPNLQPTDKLKKGNWLFGGGATDDQIQDRLLKHFDKFDALEARGDAFVAAGKREKAFHAYKLAASGGLDSAIDKVVTLLMNGVKATDVDDDKIINWLNVKGMNIINPTDDDNYKCGQLFENYRNKIITERATHKNNPAHPSHHLAIDQFKFFALLYYSKAKDNGHVDATLAHDHLNNSN